MAKTGKILAIIIKFIVKIISFLSDIVFKWIYYNKKKVLPPISNSILLESATSLAEKIRNKKVTSKEVVTSFINRIEEINPVLNCVVDKLFDEALAAAEEIDKSIQDGKISVEEMAKDTPFLGVPFTVKESLAIKGGLWAVGLVSRRGKRAVKDCDAVAMMRKSGAIPLAITNVSELCMWFESSNNLYGTSRNPYDTTRIVGGSSGGEACLLSACGSPFGIGSDIGGSIRLPAFFNGIFGHKPSKGLISNIGQMPVPHVKLDELLVVGPMCRFTSDLLPMLKCIEDPTASNHVSNAQVDLKQIKIYYMEDDGGIPLTAPVSNELKLAQKKVLDHFNQNYNTQITKVDLPKIRKTLEMWSVRISGDGIPKFGEEMTEHNGCVNAYLELLKWIFRCSPHTLPAIGLALFEKFSNDLSNESKNRKIFSEMLEEFKFEMNEMLGEDGIFIYPSQPKVASYHNQPIVEPFSFLYTALFNALQLPVTQCPLGLSNAGLPLGIQVAAGSYKDHLTLSIASELEKAFGGWVCPSTVL